MNDFQARGGPRARNVLVDGKEYWVGRSRSGRYLEGLFASEAEALSAGDALDEAIADIETGLEHESLTGLSVKAPDGGTVIVFWDEQNDTVYQNAYAYDPLSDESMKEVQEALNLIEQNRNSDDQDCAAPRSLR